MTPEERRQASYEAGRRHGAAAGAAVGGAIVALVRHRRAILVVGLVVIAAWVLL